MKNYEMVNARAYILYMIIGSYFHTVQCKTLRRIKKLFLDYKNMPVRKQIQEEEKIIEQFENNYPELIKKIVDLDCEISIEKWEDLYIIHMDTYFEDVLIIVDGEGRYSIDVIEE